MKSSDSLYQEYILNLVGIFKYNFKSYFMVFRGTIDKMAWVRSQAELDAIEAMRKAQEEGGYGEEWQAAWRAYDAISTRPPLREAGLEHAVFYAFQARAAHEIVGLAEKYGPTLREMYSLYPAGQAGIGLNWELLSKRIWVPAPFLTNIAKGSQAILDQDERNCLRPSYDGHPEHRALAEVLDGSSETKIGKLLTDHHYRALARKYCKALLYCTKRYIEAEIKPEFIPVFQAMLDAYTSEML